MTRPLYIFTVLLTHIVALIQAASFPRTRKCLQNHHGVNSKLQDKPATSVSTPLGTAQGVADTSTVTRFVVRYASAGRWQDPSVATQWELP